MNDLFTDSFEIPRGQPSRDGDIELGTDVSMNSGELGLENFFKNVQEIEKQNDKLDKLLRKLQDAHEETKAVTKAPSTKVIKKRMEKDVDEVEKVARFVKSKIEELDRENLANRQKPGCGKGTGVDRSRTTTTLYSNGTIAITDTLAEIQERHDAVRDLEKKLLDLQQGNYLTTLKLKYWLAPRGDALLGFSVPRRASPPGFSSQGRSRMLHPSFDNSERGSVKPPPYGSSQPDARILMMRQQSTLTHQSLGFHDHILLPKLWRKTLSKLSRSSEIFRKLK